MTITFLSYASMTYRPFDGMQCFALLLSTYKVFCQEDLNNPFKLDLYEFKHAALKINLF